MVSFETPEYTANADALGTFGFSKASRILGLTIVSVSTKPPHPNSMAIRRRPQSENTPFQPRSPYAVAKFMRTGSRSITVRPMAFHVSNGILFNHEGLCEARPS